MILRSYRVTSAMNRAGDINDYGTLPGSKEHKIDSFFRTTEAFRILDSLDIPWRVQTRERGVSIPSEIIFAMTKAQYALWRIAGGDTHCLSNEAQGMVPKRLENPVSIETEVWRVLEPLGFEIGFYDGLVNFAKGDVLISVYEDGLIRGVKWNTYVNFFYPDDSCNMPTQLTRFGFFTLDEFTHCSR